MTASKLTPTQRELLERIGLPVKPYDPLADFIPSSTTTDGWTAGKIPASTLELETRKQLVLLKARAEARRRYQAETDGDAPAFDLATLGELVTRGADAAAWRVEGVIPADGNTLVTAQRKTGKTTLMANLARCLLTAEPFLGMFTTLPVQGKVCLFNYEVAPDQIGRWLTEAGVPLDRCLVVNLRGRRNPLAHEDDRAKLATLLREQEVEAVLVDPFANAFTGDSQNDNSEVKRWLLTLEEFVRTDVGATDLVLTNHAGWDGTRTRGASALEDWPDSLVLLTQDAQGQRKLSASGRDVDLAEGFLDFNPITRHLTFDGTGNRVMDEKMAELHELADAIVAAVCEQPGMGSVQLSRALTAMGVTFRKEDLQRARDLAVGGQRIVVKREGQKQACYPAEGAETVTTPTASQFMGGQE